MMTMTMTRVNILSAAIILLSASAFSQTTPPVVAPAHVSPAEAKNHIGENGIVCGKVVENQVSKYGITGRGKPVLFFVDQPQASAVFYFVAFGAQPDGPDEVTAAYQGKSVCVSGKINSTPTGPYIMAADRSQVKVGSAESK
jgi:hypothetical protein